MAGASSGIGAATATRLAAHGFPVALGARRVEKCQELVDEINAGGGEAVALPLDVTDADAVKSFVHGATEALGEIELLVAAPGTPTSAGSTRPAPPNSRSRSRSI